MTLEDIKAQIQVILEKNGLLSNKDSFYPGYSGDVMVELSSSLYISHMKNFSEALEKLAKINSPISDDGYTGIEINEPPYTDTKEFLLDILYLMDNSEKKVLFIESLMKEGADREDIDTIFNKCIKLNELGFESLLLVDSSHHKEWFAQEKAILEKEKEEDLEDHYFIDDYPSIPVEDAGHYRG